MVGLDGRYDSRVRYRVACARGGEPGMTKRHDILNPSLVLAYLVQRVYRQTNRRLCKSEPGDCSQRTRPGQQTPVHSG